MDDSTQDEDSWGWQATATSMKDRTTYLWKNNPIPFNVTFDVGPKGQKERIGAHRQIYTPPYCFSTLSDFLSLLSGIFWPYRAKCFTTCFTAH